jgi:hypothetical protein
MNLSSIKSAAEAAMTDSLALDFWREDISPDDVLRLVEVARAAMQLRAVFSNQVWAPKPLADLDKALEGIEP